MWNLTRVNRDECQATRQWLEEGAHSSFADSPLRSHLAACKSCQSIAADLEASRQLLQAMPVIVPGPWFVPKVMASIAALEAEGRGVRETWTALVPKLAAKLTCVCALALLLAAAWLYETPHLPSSVSAIEASSESIFGASSRPTAPATNDDVLVSLVEQQ